MTQRDLPHDDPNPPLITRALDGFLAEFERRAGLTLPGSFASWALGPFQEPLQALFSSLSNILQAWVSALRTPGLRDLNGTISATCCNSAMSGFSSSLS